MLHFNIRSISYFRYILRIGNKSCPHSPAKRLIHAILSALFCVNVHHCQPCLIFWFNYNLFCNLMGFFLSHRESNKVLSISFIILKSGDGNTDSLYINCDSSSDFIIVVLPYRVNFRWPHIFYYIDDFCTTGVIFMFTTFSSSGVTSIPNTLSGFLAQCRDGFVSIKSSFILAEPI